MNSEKRGTDGLKEAGMRNEWTPDTVENVGWIRDDRVAFVDSRPPNDGHTWYAVVLRNDFQRLRAHCAGIASTKEES